MRWSVPYVGLLLLGCGRIGFETLSLEVGSGTGGSAGLDGETRGGSAVGGETGAAGDVGAAGGMAAGGEGGAIEPVAGSSGAAGTTDAAGATGLGGGDDPSAGAGGGVGVGGAAGTAGSVGSGGDVGVGGSVGAGGEVGGGGEAGAAGEPGAAGTVGAGGSAGAAGSVGTGGSTGAAGSVGTGGSAGGPDVPHCSELPYLDQAPVLDGSIETGMILETVVPVGWRGTTTPLPSGHGMRYAAGWRPDGLYFYLEVTDPDRNVAPAGEDVWMGDSAEIYVDHDGSFDTDPPLYDDVGTRQFFVQAPPEDVAPGARAQIRIPLGTYNPWDAGWISLPTSFGYVVETFITAPDLDLSTWSLAAGQTVGIDLAHNVSVPPGDTGEEGNRLGQYFLKVRDPLQDTSFDYPYMNEHVFCVAVLAAP